MNRAHYLVFKAGLEESRLAIFIFSNTVSHADFANFYTKANRAAVLLSGGRVDIDFDRGAVTCYNGCQGMSGLKMSADDAATLRRLLELQEDVI